MTMPSGGQASSYSSRIPKPRRYLMCAPAYFKVRYSINPWMDPSRPMDANRAMEQWQKLLDCLLALGHKVDFIEPVPDLPDMVFSANGATVMAGRVLVARFHNRERAPEARAYMEWFHAHGYPDTRVAARINEGGGDHLITSRAILAGLGFRTEAAA